MWVMPCAAASASKRSRGVSASNRRSSARVWRKARSMRRPSSTRARLSMARSRSSEVSSWRRLSARHCHDAARPPPRSPAPAARLPWWPAARGRGWGRNSLRALYRVDAGAWEHATGCSQACRQRAANAQGRDSRRDAQGRHGAPGSRWRGGGARRMRCVSHCGVCTLAPGLSLVIMTFEDERDHRASRKRETRMSGSLSSCLSKSVALALTSAALTLGGCASITPPSADRSAPAVAQQASEDTEAAPNACSCSRAALPTTA